MDVQNMDTMEDGSFDVAIDKGTMDALMCGTCAGATHS